MGADTTTAAAIAKEVYRGQIVKQTQDEVLGLKRIERSSEGVEHKIGGKYVTFPIRVSRNQGIGYRNESEALQPAGNQGYTSVRVPIRYGYGRVQLSGPSMKLIKTDYQAFASLMEQEMTGLKDDIVKDTNRIFYGDGLGTLATVTADAANTFTVALADLRFLEVGIKVDVVTPAGVSHAANRTITAINEATGVCTYDGADASASIVATDIVTRAGNYGREPQGLTSIVKDTGTLFNVDPTVTPKWKGVVRNNTGAPGTPRALSEGLMIQTVDQVRRNGGKTSLILTSLGVRVQYFALLTQQRRYADTKEFAGGFTGLVFNHGREIPVVDDVDHPTNKMNFLDESSLTVYRDEDWNWEDTDGNVWKWVTGFDVFEALLKQYWEIATNRRNANAVLTDIIE